MKFTSADDLEHKRVNVLSAYMCVVGDNAVREIERYEQLADPVRVGKQDLQRPAFDLINVITVRLLPDAFIHKRSFFMETVSAAHIGGAYMRQPLKMTALMPRNADAPLQMPRTGQTGEEGGDGHSKN